MNRFLEFISRGLHQIQRTFFSELEHEAGLILETLVHLTTLGKSIVLTVAAIHDECIPIVNENFDSQNFLLTA